MAELAELRRITGTWEWKFVTRLELCKFSRKVYKKHEVLWYWTKWYTWQAWNSVEYILFEENWSLIEEWKSVISTYTTKIHVFNKFYQSHKQTKWIKYRSRRIFSTGFQWKNNLKPTYLYFSQTRKETSKVWTLVSRSPTEGQTTSPIT